MLVLEPCHVDHVANVTSDGRQSYTVIINLIPKTQGCD